MLTDDVQRMRGEVGPQLLLEAASYVGGRGRTSLAASEWLCGPAAMAIAVVVGRKRAHEMTPKRTVYRVLPSGDDWIVKRDGAEQAARRFDRKQDAIVYARRVAKNNRPSQVVVHRQDGTIETEWTYNGDPYPPPG